MRVIVTCGPSYEPIDRVRRLTNFSTGELGLLLSATLTRGGHEVICLKGEGATSPLDAGGAKVVPFSTNEALLREFGTLSAAGGIGAVFHAAALCDYRVKAAHGPDGNPLTAAKLRTRDGDLTLSLEPAAKLLPQLRPLFPTARIVGWKYELDGTRDDAIALARRQLDACRSDASIVNGAAWGEGFGFVEPGREPIPIADKPALCVFLAAWLATFRREGGCSPMVR